MNQKARAKTTAIRQTLDLMGTELSHAVADGSVEIENAETIELTIRDKTGTMVFRREGEILKRPVVV